MMIIICPSATLPVDVFAHRDRKFFENSTALPCLLVRIVLVPTVPLCSTDDNDVFFINLTRCHLFIDDSCAIFSE